MALPVFELSVKMVQAAFGEYTLQTILHSVVDAGLLNRVLPANLVSKLLSISVTITIHSSHNLKRKTYECSTL